MSDWLVTLSTQYPHLVYGFTVVFACIEGPILSVLFGFLLQLGYFNFFLVFAALMVGDLLGDVFWYWIGRKYGHGFIRRFGKYIGATEDGVRSVSNIFHRHKDSILIISKVTNGFGFALVTLMTAGMVKIPFRRYMTLNFLGQFVWTGILISVGYFFGNFFSAIDRAFGRISAIGSIAVGALVVFLIFRYVSERVSARMSGERRRISASVEPRTVFTIVIPAHNESRYIAATLAMIQALDYPHDLYETIVVENGSEDDTTDVVRRFVSPNLRLIHSEKGVSRARNVGMAAAASKSEWFVLLDADTHLKPRFLRELDWHLREHADDDLVVGTTAILPQGPRRLYARAWFAFYNWGHKVFKVSYAIQLARADLRDRVRYDEELRFTEDQKFIKDMREYGRFFYLDTREVTTSTRRFDEVGWFKLYFVWLFESMFLSKMKSRRHGDYPVIR